MQRSPNTIRFAVPRINLEAGRNLAADAVFPIALGKKFEVLAFNLSIARFVFNLNVRKVNSRSIDRQSILSGDSPEQDRSVLFGKPSGRFFRPVDLFLQFKIETDS